MKIKYNAPYRLEFLDKGEFVDLHVVEDYNLEAPIVVEDKVVFSLTMIDLGIAMQLPKDFEAVILPRSGTPKKHGIMLANSAGIIDSTYCGDNDRWKFAALSFRSSEISKDTRICQFTIRPSMKASIWTKIKWLFTQRIDFEYVEKLNNADRGGFGSTGL